MHIHIIYSSSFPNFSTIMEFYNSIIYGNDDDDELRSFLAKAKTWTPSQLGDAGALKNKFIEIYQLQMVSTFILS